MACGGDAFVGGDVFGHCLFAACGRGQMMQTMRRRAILIWILLLLGIGSTQYLCAEEEKEPAELEADEIDYNRNTKEVVAKGNVVVLHQGKKLFAERVVYNRERDEIKAFGDVRLHETTGDIFTATEMELHDNMKEGVFTWFQAHLANRSHMIAKKARRLDPDHYTLEQSLYSACGICHYDKNNLQWRLRAKKTSVDKIKEEVSHQHVMLDSYGVPVLYIPYLRHPGPGAKRKSGFLTPRYQTRNTLGANVTIPYYLAIAPQMDMTITPTFYTRENPLLALEWRHLLPRGTYTVKASGLYPRDKPAPGVLYDSERLRGHIIASGTMTPAKNWLIGASLYRTSDDTYLRRYEISEETSLKSNIYIENSVPSSYFKADTIFYQELAPEVNLKEVPVIMPYMRHLAEYKTEHMPGSIVMDNSVLQVMREQGQDTRRVSTNIAWRLPWHTSHGHAFTWQSGLRLDGYSMHYRGSRIDKENLNGQTGRGIPTLRMDWLYPLMRPGQDWSMYIEPHVAGFWSTSAYNPHIIPNEDSLELGLTAENLFHDQHYIGIDRVEGGARASYAIEAASVHHQGYEVRGLIGQHYRASDTHNILPRNSGMVDKVSDYVGKLQLIPNQYVDFAYGFRVNHRTLARERENLMTTITYAPFTWRTDIMKKHDADQPIMKTRREIFSLLAVALTPEWNAHTFGRRNIGDMYNDHSNRMVEAGGGVTYLSGCMRATVSLRRSFIHDRDVPPDTKFMFEIALRTLAYD
jgi:LPS-assembly protein